MKKAEMTTEAPAQTVDEVIKTYLDRVAESRKTQPAEHTVKIHDQFQEYVETLTGEDRPRALEIFVNSWLNVS